MFTCFIYFRYSFDDFYRVTIDVFRQLIGFNNEIHKLLRMEIQFIIIYRRKSSIYKTIKRYKQCKYIFL